MVAIPNVRFAVRVQVLKNFCRPHISCLFATKFGILVHLITDLSDLQIKPDRMLCEQLEWPIRKGFSRSKGGGGGRS